MFILMVNAYTKSVLINTGGCLSIFYIHVVKLNKKKCHYAWLYAVYLLL